jgi:hypothetical protein
MLGNVACTTSDIVHMGWVEVYEYDLGFCIIRTLVQTSPKENNYNSKYIMGPYWIEKKNPSLEALTMEGMMKIIKYPNLFHLGGKKCC